MMKENKYVAKNGSPDMASEPLHAYNDYVMENETATIEDSDYNLNKELDELALQAIKLGVEQIEKGRCLTMEESLRRINEKLGLS